MKLAVHNRAASSQLDKIGQLCYYEIVMKNIKQKIEIITNGYNPREFMPIWSGGELINRSDFVKYKLKKIILHRTLV